MSNTVYDIVKSENTKLSKRFFIEPDSSLVSWNSNGSTPGRFACFFNMDDPKKRDKIAVVRGFYVSLRSLSGQISTLADGGGLRLFRSTIGVDSLLDLTPGKSMSIGFDSNTSLEGWGITNAWDGYPDRSQEELLNVQLDIQRGWRYVEIQPLVLKWKDVDNVVNDFGANVTAFLGLRVDYNPYAGAIEKVPDSEILLRVVYDEYST